MKRQNYTLVELLVVIAIVGILLGISIPAFEKAVKGNRVNHAASNIGTAISLARAQAIANRKYVGVIIPADSVDSLSGTINTELKQYQYKGFRLCYLTTTDGSNFTFESWLPGSKWIMLPESTVVAEIDSVTSSGSILSNDFSSSDYSALKNVAAVKPFLTAAAVPSCAIIFTPFGSTINSSLRVIVTEGVFASSSSKTYTNKDSSNKPLNIVVIKVNKFTGRASYETGHGVDE